MTDALIERRLARFKSVEILNQSGVAGCKIHVRCRCYECGEVALSGWRAASGPAVGRSQQSSRLEADLSADLHETFGDTGSRD